MPHRRNLPRKLAGLISHLASQGIRYDRSNAGIAVCWIGSPRDVVLRTRSQSQLLFGGPGCANFFKCDKGAKVGPLGHVILPRSTREASWSLGHLGDFEKVVRAPGRDGVS